MKHESSNVAHKAMQFLHEEGGELVFVDPSNGAQVAVSKELVGDAADLLTDNLPCTMSFFHERPIDVALPTFVQLVVTATEPGAAGEVTKKATVETGAVILVPLFIGVDDTIEIDTRTHDYVERIERLHN